MRKKNRPPRLLAAFALAGLPAVPAPGTVAPAAGSGESAAPAGRPNFVLLIADDMAWDDCGPYGNPAVRTPHLDRLARGGMRFEQAFVTISSCSPSRASLITGRYPHRTGAEELHWPLPAGQDTFVRHLKAAGYWTGAAGKWHLGEAVRPHFDVVEEVDTSGFQLPAGAAGQAGRFVETQQGEARSGCADWVPLLRRRPRDEPFFLWLAALDPHRPYSENILPQPHLPGDVRVAPYHPDTPAVRADYARYYDEVTRLDRYVGAVLDELEEQGAAGDTFVLFISDNGRPFPRDKTTLYDSGIRTPFIVRWPGRVAPGTTSPALVSTVDVAPTLLELAGLKTGRGGQDLNLDGRSFAPQLADPAAPGRPYAFAEKNWHDYEDHARAARGPRYKYIRNGYPDLPLTPPADAVRSPTYAEMRRLRAAGKLSAPQLRTFISPRPREELYDTRVDPHEMVNLAADSAHAAALGRLRAALDDWEARTGDRRPALRTADEFDRETGVPTPARFRPRWSRARMVEAGLAAP